MGIYLDAAVHSELSSHLAILEARQTLCQHKVRDWGKRNLKDVHAQTDALRLVRYLDWDKPEGG